MKPKTVLSRRTTVLGALALGGLLTGCSGGGGAISSLASNNGTGAATPFSFGALSGRAVASNPPVVTNAAMIYGALGPTVVGLTGQITNLELNDSTNNIGATKIVYASNRDANFFNSQIYVMNADGSNSTRLTNSSAGNTEPAVSPDGTKVVFTSTRDGNAEIYVMNIDGSNQTRLTNNGASDSMPSWSPDGTKIVFISNRNSFPEVFTMNADGTTPKQVTNIQLNVWYPSWSPDGSRILFTTSKDGNRELYTIKPDGTAQTRLTSNNIVDDHGVWSPDGSRIAFHTNRDGNYQIYVMAADGSVPTRLTNNASTDTMPAWSPDGTQITFLSDRSGTNQVYTMKADGTFQVRLTNDLKPSTSTAWSPFFSRRVLVGASPAPFAQASGFLFAKQGLMAKSVLVYQTTNATDFAQVVLNPLTGQNNQGSSLIVQVEPTTNSVTLSGLRFWNLSSPSWTNVAPQGFTLTGALVSFSASTGEVDYVLPFKASNRSAGSPRVQMDGSVRSIHGNFAGVWDRNGNNLASHGASEVRLDAQTGKLLGIR